MRKSEGTLEFDFKTALSVEQPEVKAQPLKCVDFLVQEQSATWMIEVTDALKAASADRIAAVNDLLGQMKSGQLTKDMLMKLYGTHAHMAQARIKPGTIVYFCIVLGIYTTQDKRGREDNAQRTRIRDEMKRVTNRIGPSFWGATNRPIIQVDSIETWNENHPDMLIERLPAG